ncbi:MAG TPA: 16S rRNA (cytosine(1402)-N(4))-methyltransferase, partial [Actinokineospora sp.]|nr:16S rRNA (cytosine(1402)-N(4))-methyltransferase [Actinokineospora sp.]
MTEQPRHVPVLLDRILDLFDPVLSGRAAVLVDATLGLGGHADALLSAHPSLTLVGLDRDPNALAMSADRLARHGDRVHL